METYGKFLNLAIPVFMILFFIEHLVERRRGVKVIRSLDSVSSFSSGITNVVKDVLGLSIGILSYQWLLEQIAVFKVENSLFVIAIAFLVIDFQGYWVHRWSHEINFLWNRHIIHHSSEEYNLSCALRQTISTVFNYFTFLLLPAAFFGIPGEVIAVVAPLHLFLQYWYHTRLIGRLGFLEKVIVTPSHHRVHHAINPEYMDKNYSQVFIFWDKLFGTFQEERADVPPVYGVKRPARTWNPIKINFQHFWLMLSDAVRTHRLWDKIRIWFMPTGWRPADVKDRYPVFAISDVYHFEKYDTPASRSLIAWSWVQMFFNYFLLIYFFAFISKIGVPGIYLYGVFIFLSIYAYTELMDFKKHAFWLELLKSAVGLGLIYYYGDWFGASLHAPFYTLVTGLFFVVSPIIVGWFVRTELNRREKPAGVELA
jgi:sterol desaturase/sphingolipid hydroxylase (fatty acid hydroxylase superfamily)